eukprot:6174349-Amphidinium_carterae.1
MVRGRLPLPPLAPLVVPPLSPFVQTMANQNIEAVLAPFALGAAPRSGRKRNRRQEVDEPRQ